MLHLGNKLLIIGSPGSGKSWLATEIARTENLPVIHLDSHYWGENWVACEENQWQCQVESLCNRPCWIMDGSYSSTLALRLRYATAVIYLDMPRWKCLIRILKRQLLHFSGFKRHVVAPGCPERISGRFYRWVWNYPKRSKAKTLMLLDAFSGPVIHLKSNREIDGFLLGVELS